jgi:hypothetical protein
MVHRNNPKVQDLQVKFDALSLVFEILAHEFARSENYSILQPNGRYFHP